MPGRRKDRGARPPAGGHRPAAVEWVAALVLAGWGIGQVARDATLPTALIFYLPSLAVAALLLALAAFARWRSGRWLWIALAALPPLLVVVAVENRWPGAGGESAGESAPRGERLRVVHWNVAGGWTGADAEAAEIARRDPDLVVLSEGPSRVARRVSAHLPGFQARSFGALSFLARDLDEGRWLERRRDLQVVWESFSWHSRRWSLLAVNLGSSPWQARDPLLREVVRRIEQVRPDLVVGDFNAPRRSWALAALPAGYRHAYDEAGRGWSATWPMPVPLLALDQAIVGPRLRAVGYHLTGTSWSDHRLQLVELVARPGAAEPTP